MRHPALVLGAKLVRPINTAHAEHGRFKTKVRA
jgi:hypothetical protein